MTSTHRLSSPRSVNNSTPENLKIRNLARKAAAERARSKTGQQGHSALPSDPQRAEKGCPAGGILRKGATLIAALTAGVQSNPGIFAAVSLAATGAGIARSYRGGNPESIKVFIVDTVEQKIGHRDHVAYVAKSNIKKGSNAEVISIKEGFSDDFCGSFDEIKKLADKEPPPKVIVLASRSSPAYMLLEEIDRKKAEMQETIGHSDFSQLSPEHLKSLRREVKEDILESIDIFRNIDSCDDGKSLPQKRTETYEHLVNSGISVVVSAGNEGEMVNICEELGFKPPQKIFNSLVYGGGNSLPPGVLVVGGAQVHPDGTLQAASYSNPHPAVDIVAKSTDVRVNAYGDRDSGTSFSAPRVGALVANMLAINPKLKPVEIEDIIRSTATKMEGDRIKVGAGFVSEKRALAAAKDSLLA